MRVLVISTTGNSLAELLRPCAGALDVRPLLHVLNGGRIDADLVVLHTQAPIRELTALATLPPPRPPVLVVAHAVVPAWTILRRSLSSDAAASLITAFTRAAAATGSFSAAPNQTVASGLPPRVTSSARMIRDDSMVEPSDALATVLEISISAHSMALGGRLA